MVAAVAGPPEVLATMVPNITLGSLPGFAPDLEYVTHFNGKRIDGDDDDGPGNQEMLGLNLARVSVCPVAQTVVVDWPNHSIQQSDFRATRPPGRLTREAWHDARGRWRSGRCGGSDEKTPEIDSVGDCLHCSPVRLERRGGAIRSDS